MSPPRRTFGGTWWGKAWTDALENRARLDPNRLPRGRTYARHGRVLEIGTTAGEITAVVAGNRPQPYRVRIRVRTFTDAEWDAVVDAICAKAAHAAALLDGELDPGVVEDARSVGVDVLPGPGDLQPRCSCPDWADPCKHAAAVCYLVADELDADPFTLFAVRGRERDELLAAVRRERSRRAGGGLGLEGGGAGGPVRPADQVDPGIPARQAWGRAAGPLPQVPLARDEPGPPAPWPVDPPDGASFTAAGLRALATDAATRAHAALRDAEPTALTLDGDDDLSRRAADALGGDDWSNLVRASGVASRTLVSRALAWRAAGRAGVAFAAEPSWTPAPLVVAPGRRALVDAGAPESGIRVSGNRVSAAALDLQLRVDRDGRWWPFTRQRGRWEVAAAPADTPEDALDAVLDRAATGG